MTGAIISPESLGITFLLALGVALTTVVGMAFWKNSERLLSLKDVFLFLIFAVTEPFSDDGSAEMTTFSLHAILAVVTYLVARRVFTQISALDVWKTRIPGR